MKNKRTLGLLLAILAYILWGCLVYYWHLLSHVPSMEVFSYRIVFTVIVMSLYFLVTGKTKKLTSELTDLVKKPKSRYLSLLASLFLGLNWLTFIYAVSINEATEASIAGFIMPIVSVLLAVIFLHERLEPFMKAAVAIALVGVAVMVIGDGKFPLLTFIMSVCFPIYGLLKKYYQLSSDVAMVQESLVLLPFVLIYLFGFAGHSFFGYNLPTMFGLFMSGPVTALPLLLFAEAIKRADYSVVGFIQYLNPVISLGISVLLLDESLNTGDAWSLLFIGSSILLFVIGQILLVRKKGR